MICSHDKYLQVIAHLYRGEMNRLTTYRQRLDTISNWSISTLIALIVFYIGNDKIPAKIIFIFIMPIFLFSLIEARRYRYYLVSQSRINCIEKGFYVQEIFQIEIPQYQHRHDLIQSLSCPSYPISLWKAWLIRFYRNYIWLIYFVLMTWFLKIEMVHQISMFFILLFSIIIIALSLSHVYIANFVDSTIDI